MLENLDSGILICKINKKQNTKRESEIDNLIDKPKYSDLFYSN